MLHLKFAAKLRWGVTWFSVVRGSGPVPSSCVRSIAGPSWPADTAVAAHLCGPYGIHRAAAAPSRPGPFRWPIPATALVSESLGSRPVGWQVI
jgi:hypothetical protein